MLNIDTTLVKVYVLIGRSNVYCKSCFCRRLCACEGKTRKIIIKTIRNERLSNYSVAVVGYAQDLQQAVKLCILRYFTFNTHFATATTFFFVVDVVLASVLVVVSCCKKEQIKTRKKKRKKKTETLFKCWFHFDQFFENCYQALKLCL